MCNVVVLPIFYLPPIRWFAEYLNETNKIVLEEWENFAKQTYRNRTEIYGANGKLSLIIPIRHTEKRLYKEKVISYAEDWQKLHWKSIKIAYRRSPYFEFYESELENIYTFQVEKLMDFNVRTLQIILKLLKIDRTYTFTLGYKYSSDYNNLIDSFSAKKKSDRYFKQYHQVFSDKLGYIPNLSILDLLCNLGPRSVEYLKNFK